MAGDSVVGGQRQEGDAELAGEGVWRSSQNGNVMWRVHTHDRDLKQDWWAFGTVNEDVGLAAVPESIKDMGDSQKVALLVDEEGVAKKRIVITAGGRSFV